MRMMKVPKKVDFNTLCCAQCVCYLAAAAAAVVLSCFFAGESPQRRDRRRATVVNRFAFSGIRRFSC